MDNVLDRIDRSLLIDESAVYSDIIAGIGIHVIDRNLDPGESQRIAGCRRLDISGIDLEESLVLKCGIEFKNRKICVLALRHNLGLNGLIAIYADLDHLSLVGLLLIQVHVLLNPGVAVTVKMDHVVIGHQVVRIYQKACSCLDIDHLVGLLILDADTDLQDALLVVLYGVIAAGGAAHICGKCRQAHRKHQAQRKRQRQQAFQTLFRFHTMSSFSRRRRVHASRRQMFPGTRLHNAFPLSSRPHHMLCLIFVHTARHAEESTSVAICTTTMICVRADCIRIITGEASLSSAMNQNLFSSAAQQ